jgi:hypothetical protein
MSSTKSAPNAGKAILFAGLLCSVLDGLSATGLTLALGGTPLRLWQGVARGLLGPAAMQQGTRSAAIGLAAHVVVAFGATIVYYLASRVLPVMIRRALLCGMIYGALVHLFMTFVVIPLSAIGPRPIVWRGFCYVLAIHMIVVGPTIALTLRRYLR